MSSLDLLHEPPLEQQFLEIIQEYTKLKDIGYLSHNIFTTDKEIINLKKKIKKFKELEENMTSKIHEIERHIIEKNDFLQKFGIEYGRIPQLRLESFDINDFTERISNLSIFGDKDSASLSLILRSKYLRESVFIKAFSPTQKNLENELKIYNYINEVKKILDPSVKSYLDDYFIELKRIFVMDKKIFFDYLDKNNIKQIKHDEEQKTYYSTTKEALINKIPKEFDLDVICFIVTKDIEGESLELKCNILNRIEEKRKEPYRDRHPDYDGEPHINTRKELINIIFELIYGLYLLNKYFRVRHNDLHFNNVIFKEIHPIDKNFIIGNKTIKKRSNIRLAIYDFDKSWITSQSEAENSEDIRIIRLWFTRNMYDGVTLKEISRNINLFDSFNLEEMLLRFIHHYYRELDIEEIDPFFKKYLKYKNKYLQLKKNI
jgi:hypothetical protein